MQAFAARSYTAQSLRHPRGGRLPAITLPTAFGYPVRFLWMVPITESERKFAMEMGGEALAKKLESAGFGAINVMRQSVV